VKHSDSLSKAKQRADVEQMEPSPTSASKINIEKEKEQNHESKINCSRNDFNITKILV
jgi:hypothetical protein